MFKNTTRRGLALGAALSLVVTGLVSTPAQAAGEVVLVPSAGTSYNTLVTEDFTLQASLGVGQPAGNAVQLKYQISKAAGSTISYGVSTSGAVTTGTDLAAAATSVVVAADGAGATTQNFIKLNVKNATSVSDTVNVTVTAFIDSDNDNVLDSGEFQAAQTVSFKKYSEVTTTVALTQPTDRDTTVDGTLVLDGINRDQVQSAVGAVASKNGTAEASVSATSTFSVTVAVAKSNTFSAHAVVDNYKVGAESATYTATGSTVFAVTSSAVTGDNAKTAGAAATVRTNGEFVARGTVLDGTTSTASGVAGAAVTLKVTVSGTLSTTRTLAINGTVYTDSAKLPTALALTSDASGNVTATIKPTGFAANETVNFQFTSQSLASDMLVATQTDAVYTAKAAGTGYQTVALSGAIAVDYTVADQWSVAAPGNYRVVVAYDGTTKYLPLVAGAVTATFTATSSDTTISVTNTSIQSQSATTLNWANVSGAVTASAVAVKSTATAASFTTAPTHSATATIARATTSNKAGYLSQITINGKVNHPGYAVTITSANAKFSDKDQGTAAVAGSVTTNADGDGWFTVSAYVSVAGKTSFNYVAGAATASTEVTVAAAKGNEGKNLTIVVVSGDNAAPGSTIRAKAVLTDEFGNPVAADNAATESFGVAISGPGFIGTLPTKFGTDGETAEFSILLGSGDTTGTVTITATYDADATGTAVAAITAVKSVVIGEAPASNQKLTVGSFKGYVAIYTLNYTGQKLSAKVAGKWLVVNSLSKFQRVVRNTGAGFTIKVDLYIDGAFVRSETIVTK